jgi:hypothetical protein
VIFCVDFTLLMRVFRSLSDGIHHTPLTGLRAGAFTAPCPPAVHPDRPQAKLLL